MTFGQRLKAERTKAGISQAQLAGDRFSVSYISHLEAGRREPTPQVIDYLAQRLHLDRGLLSGADWGGTPAAQRGDSASLAALTSRAITAHAKANVVATVEAAEEGLALAQQLDRPEVWWLLSLLLVDSYIAGARYPEASAVATQLPDHPWVQQSPELLTEASLAAARALRFCAQREAAQVHARRALELTTNRDAEDPQRLQALMGALAVGVQSGVELEDELAALVETCRDRHNAGLAAWSLGTSAFARGDVENGLQWHLRADGLISPESNYRDWARFARASADERVKAGVDDGVEELLERARYALGVLGNSDELGDLARTRALWLSRTDPEAALAELDTAIAGEMPDLTLGRMLLQRVSLLRALDRVTEARTTALDAARRLTVANARDEALDAWDLVDQLS